MSPYLFQLVWMFLAMAWMYLYYRSSSLSRQWEFEYQMARQELESLRAEYLQLLSQDLEKAETVAELQDLVKKMEMASVRASEWDLQ